MNFGLIINHINSINIRHLLISILLIIVMTVLLIWPALYNGYPLVYSDTGTYILSGFKGIVPVDRPILYGLFIRHISMSHSLWFVIIAQALILIFLLTNIVGLIISRKTIATSFLIVLILSITTSISNYTSQIMPDIFSAYAIMGMIILLVAKRFKWKEVIIMVIVIFSAMAHLSNMAVVLGMTLIACFVSIFKLVRLKNLLYSLITSILPIFLIMFVNYGYTAEYFISRSRNIFIVSRMIETGVIDEFLTENCNQKNYILCNCIDQIPDQSFKFLWNEESPLYNGICINESWDHCWIEKDEAFGELVNDIIATPKYLKVLLRRYSHDFFSQLFIFEIGPLIPMKEHTPPYDLIKENFANEFQRYMHAKQYNKTQEFEIISFFQSIIILLSGFLLLALLLFWKRFLLTSDTVKIIVFAVMGMVGNAITVSILSTVLNRYQSRLIWIIPLIGLSIVIKLYQERKQILKDNQFFRVSFINSTD